MLFNYYNTIHFAQPQFFWLMLLLPLMAIWYLQKNDKNNAGLKVSSSNSFAGLSSWKNMLMHVPVTLRLGCLFCLIVALARPQTKSEQQQFEGEGIDIILCIDVSGSMTAQDFTPNRMEAAKNVALEFVEKRATDRIGVVIFSGESFTQCPLTTDQQVLQTSIENIHNGLLEDGTAIGDGLATGVDRLRNSKAKSKVIILLTDGENNGGLIDPSTAKEIAKTYGIKVYTVGVGTEGYAPFPVQTNLGVVMQNEKVTIDEDLLKNIASETGGKYFRAKNTQGLNDIYDEIDHLEKSKIQTTTFTSFNEKFFPFAILALLFLLMEAVLRFTVLKKFP